MNDLHNRDFQRILLIKPSSPGDIIHALPVLHGLRKRFPNAHLAWLVATSFADLIAVDPALDETITFDRRRFGRVGRSLDVTRDFIHFIQQLRSRRFDLIIDLQGLFRSGFLALAGGAAVRIGPAEAREFAWMFYNHRLPALSTRVHAAELNYRVAAALGFADVPMDFTIALAHEDRHVAAEMASSCGKNSADGYAILVPGTRWETKLWPAARFGEVARAIRDATGLHSLLVGGLDDLPLAETAVAASAGAAVSVCGRTSLRQLAALIERARIVITADSTPMHMAAAANRPLVALFGPTDPRRTGPFGRLDDVIRLGLDCSPCLFRYLRQCSYDHACMQQLPVERVVDAALSRLRAAPIQ